MTTLLARRRQKSVDRVKTAFLDCERTAEEAAILSARCMLLMLEERRSSRMPIETGADALAHVADGIAHAGRAFAALAKAHPHLRVIPAQLDIVDFGTSESEDNKPFVGAGLTAGNLSVAA